MSYAIFALGFVAGFAVAMRRLSTIVLAALRDPLVTPSVVRFTKELESVAPRVVVRFIDWRIRSKEVAQ